jgi:hypothetical protein
MGTRPRLKDEPISFRPEIGIRIALDDLAGSLGCSVSEYVESIVNREVRHATATQGTPSADDRAAAV